MPVKMDKRNGVVILTMDNSPENGFTMDMIQQFNAALNKVEADDVIRGVVVTGRTRSPDGRGCPG
jgi:enoyl-CoA hydratase/carnithine racemase